MSLQDVINFINFFIRNVDILFTETVPPLSCLTRIKTSTSYYYLLLRYYFCGVNFIQKKPKKLYIGILKKGRYAVSLTNGHSNRELNGNRVISFKIT